MAGTVGRPIKFDLTGTEFGSLTVLRRRGGSPPLWECKCKCGNPEVTLVTTAQLRWNHKRDCGCGTGRRSPSLSEGRHKGYLMADMLRELVGPSIKSDLGPANLRPCTLCGLVPARSLFPAYGIADARFRQVKDDPRAYLTLCGICYSAAKLAKYANVNTATPEQWFILVTQLLPDGNLKVGHMQGLAELLIAHQTPDERVTPSGIAARKAAETLII